MQLGWDDIANNIHNSTRVADNSCTQTLTLSAYYVVGNTYSWLITTKLISMALICHDYDVSYTDPTSFMLSLNCFSWQHNSCID